MAVAMRLDDSAVKRRSLLDDLSAQARLIDAGFALAEARGLVHVPSGEGTPDAVSLADSQTPLKSQGGRGTGYAFAVCAAMEALYRRAFGVTLDLSEQYVHHVNQAGELHPDYVTSTLPHENNSSFWGFQGCSDIVGRLQRTAIPDERAAPYRDQSTLDSLRLATAEAGSVARGSTQEELDAFEFHDHHIPEVARLSARYRVTDCRALPRNPKAEDVEAVLAAGHEVVADVPGHTLLIVGYDRSRRVFEVKNSWGERELVELAYDSPDWPLLWGWYVLDVTPLNAPPQPESCWLGRWQMNHDGRHGELVIRRTTDYRNDPGAPTKLGTYYRAGHRRDVNGYTTQDGEALHFWVAASTARREPGTLAGQEFRAYLFSEDRVNAAGWTSWGDGRFGVTLSRWNVRGQASRAFDIDSWLGLWAINQDGRQASLRITSVRPLTATYRFHDGRVLTASGGLDTTHPHILRIELPIAPGESQRLDLFAHTRERNIFSGVTERGGRTSGVQGYRMHVTMRPTPAPPKRVRDPRRFWEAS